jgi:hypothetical protein
MIQSLDICRHPDGSIDFDFYRRRAIRRRRLVRRLVFRHLLFAIGQAARAVISPIENSVVHHSQAPSHSRSTRQIGAHEVVQPM